MPIVVARSMNRRWARSVWAMPGLSLTSHSTETCFWVRSSSAKVVDEMAIDGDIGEPDVEAQYVLDLADIAEVHRLDDRFNCWLGQPASPLTIILLDRS